jgi:uncharacterized protein DUF402
VWSSGEVILLRYLRDGRPAWIRPVRVVEDTTYGSVVYLAEDSPTKHPIRVDGTEIARSTLYEERFGLAWKHGDGIWDGHHTLLLTPHARAHSIWVFWTPAWDLIGWYVNLQEPNRRTPIGFDTVDQVLDLWVESDLSWSWKDEHELKAAVRLGRFTSEEATAIRAEGEQVIREWPFPTGWEDWRPDPAWPVPQLPDGWDRI